MEFLETLHSIVRWAVLGGLVWALVAGIAWLRRSRAWEPTTERPFRVTAILFDVQVTLGLILWIFGRGWEENAFIAFIHPIGMLIAVALIHVSLSKARAGGGLRTALAGFAAATVVTVLAIPWAR